MLFTLVPIILIAWFPLAILLFNKMPSGRALIFGVLAAVMFLPMGEIEMRLIPGRKDVLVNLQKIDDIARHTAVRSGCRLVDGKVNRMQDVAELVVFKGWEKSEIAIENPINFCTFIQAFDDHPSVLSRKSV